MEMELNENINIEKNAKSEYSKTGFAFFIMTAAVIIAQILLSFILEMVPSVASNFNITTIILTGSFYPIGYFILYSMLGKKNKELPQLEKNKMGKKRFFQLFTMSYFLMILGNIIGLIITSFVGDIKGDAVDNVLVETITALSPWVSLLLAVILAPIFEELFFRKFLIDRIHRFGKVPAIVVSGLMFGLFHANLNQFFYAFFLGMILSYIYLNYGDIKICIWLHMLINSIGFIFTMLSSLIDLETIEQISALDPYAQESADLIMQSAGPIIFMGIASLFVPIVVIMGFISFLKNIKTFKEYNLYSKQTEVISTKSALVNKGMILFIILTGAQIILQLIL